MTGDPDKEYRTNKPPPTRRVRERSKEDSACPSTSQNPSRYHPSWLSDACATRKDSELEWLAMQNKGNYKQGEKTALRMGENSSKWSNRQRINLKNIQATPAAQFQKNKWPNQKMGQRTKQTLLQRRHRWLTNTWKDAQHHSYQRNANQNHNEVPLHASQDDCYLKVYKQ